MDNRKNVIRLIYSLSFISFAMFTILSIITHSSNDPPFGNYPLNRPVNNYCGQVGASLSGYMLLGLGVISYIPAILMGVIGAAFLLKGGVKDLWVKAIGSILLISCLASIIYLISSIDRISIIKPEFGGILGLIIGIRLTKFLGIAGTWILLSTGFVISVILITDAQINKIFRLVLFFLLGATSNKQNASTRYKTTSYSEAKFDLAPVSQKRHFGNLFGIFSLFKRIHIPRSILKETVSVSAGQSVALNLEDSQSHGTVPALAGNNHCEHNIGNNYDLPDIKGHESPVIEQERHKEVISVLKKREDIKIHLKPERDGIRRDRVNNSISDDEYQFPPIYLLDSPELSYKSDDREQLMERASILQITLKQFNIDARVVEIEQGPVITMFELELAPGTKVGKIIGLSDDLAIALKAPSVRVVAPLPKRSSVGLEVPNSIRRIVKLREVMEDGEMKLKKQALPLAIGKDVAGNPLIADITAMPHLLIAGTTGSGKSVCLNTIILSILYLQRPDQVKLLLVDPKMVEFSPYKDIPHLITPIVTDMKKAAAVLEWAVNKMEERYALLASAGVRNITGYNRLGEKELRKRLNPENDADLEDVPFYMPYIVIIVDELADLMLVAAKEVEGSVIRLSQKSRAVGIHLILATQRPSVNVVTGLIKSNMPSRISFFVASKVDSRTILDQNGAEKLLGGGDMLFLPPGTSKLVRVQGAFVSDEEVRNIADFLREHAAPQYSPELQGWKGSFNKDYQEEDDLYNEAVRIILESQRGSVSLLQRRLGIGYSRAAKLIDLMADDGIVGEYKGSQAREVFLKPEEWEEMHKNREGRDI